MNRFLLPFFLLFSLIFLPTGFSKNLHEDSSSVIINICVDRTEKFNKEFKTLSFIKEGVFLTRDLVSEPPNVLNPKAYTQEIKKLSMKITKKYSFKKLA